MFSLDDTRRSASAAPLNHCATSSKIYVSFMDIGVKSVDLKIELAKQCSVFISVVFIQFGKPTIYS